jgi:hypothetical protein
MKYSLRFVHKVSQICACNCPQYGHRRMLPAAEAKHPGHAKWGEGSCTSCDCQEYTPKTQEVELPEALPTDRLVMGQLLRDTGLWTGSLRAIRHEANGRVVCFPRTSSWHSIILEPLPPPACAACGSAAKHEAYGLPWCGFAACIGALARRREAQQRERI